ncbi:hypothetical protein M2369_000310 [Bacillus sp. JUb11]|nr:hypothetical protein [Bacillus sp. JUb11]VXA90334.1 hypothetical protein BACI9J_10041 [Bacillus altitudinis]
MERDYEIGVLATHKIEIKDNHMLKTWRPLDEVVLGWVSVVFPNQKLPDDFKNKLFRNYKN